MITSPFLRVWLVSAVLVACRVPLPVCGAEKPQNDDALLAAVAAHSFGESRAPLVGLAARVRAALADPAQREAWARRLAAFLRSGAGVEGKRFVCRQLALVGTAESVPALASLLTHPELADIARYALEAIPGPEADAALAAALADAPDAVATGILHTLGARRSANAVPACSRLVSARNPAVARAAVSALGRIATPASLEALVSAHDAAAPVLRGHIADCALAAAHALRAAGAKAEVEPVFQAFWTRGESQAVRMSALQGLLSVDPTRHAKHLLGLLDGEPGPMQAFAADLLRRLPDAGVVSLATARLPELPSAAKALALAALADRREAAALPLARAALHDADPEVRFAAIRALGLLGGDGDAPALLSIFSGETEDLSAAARAALGRLRGPGVNAALLGAATGPDCAAPGRLVDLLVERNAGALVPDLLVLSKNAPPDRRKVFLAAVGSLAGAAHVPAIIGFVVRADDADLRGDAARTLGAAVLKIGEPAAWTKALVDAYADAPVAVRRDLSRTLAHSGAPEALALARRDLDAGDAALRDASVRTLAEWPTAEPAGDLLRLAKGDGSLAERVLSYGGAVKIAGRMAAGSPDPALQLLREALAAAPRPADRRLALAALAGVGSTAALEMALAQLNESEVVEEAAVAALKIGEALGPKKPAEVRAAAEQVLAATKIDSTKRQARALLKKLPPPG